MSERDLEKMDVALALPEVRQKLARKSSDLIYESVMRGGGEPFGAPFEVGTASLTEKIVKLLKLVGFFSFETMEKLGRRNLRNKFTRHGAAPFVGTYTRRSRKKR